MYHCKLTITTFTGMQIRPNYCGGFKNLLKFVLTQSSAQYPRFIPMLHDLLQLNACAKIVSYNILYLIYI